MPIRTVLIVDDQEDTRLLLGLALEPLGLDMHMAKDGHEALVLARSLKPDLVILDVMMPGGMDGYQVCRALRSNPATADTRIILLSGRGQQHDMEQGKHAGADHYMPKPFSPRELCALVESL